MGDSGPHGTTYFHHFHLILWRIYLLNPAPHTKKRLIGFLLKKGKKAMRLSPSLSPRLAIINLCIWPSLSPLTISPPLSPGYNVTLRPVIGDRNKTQMGNVGHYRRMRRRRSIRLYYVVQIPIFTEPRMGLDYLDLKILL